MATNKKIPEEVDMDIFVQKLVCDVIAGIRSVDIEEVEWLRSNGYLHESKDFRIISEEKPPKFPEEDTVLAYDFSYNSEWWVGSLGFTKDDELIVIDARSPHLIELYRGV